MPCKMIQIIIDKNIIQFKHRVCQQQNMQQQEQEQNQNVKNNKDNINQQRNSRQPDNLNLVSQGDRNNDIGNGNSQRQNDNINNEDRVNQQNEGDQHSSSSSIVQLNDESSSHHQNGVQHNQSNQLEIQQQIDGVMEDCISRDYQQNHIQQNSQPKKKIQPNNSNGFQDQKMVELSNKMEEQYQKQTKKNQVINIYGEWKKIYSHTIQFQNQSPIVNPPSSSSPQNIAVPGLAGSSNNNSNNDVIFNRVGHATFFYKNHLCMYGGVEIPIAMAGSINTNFIDDECNMMIFGNRKQSLFMSIHKMPTSNNVTVSPFKQSLSFGSNGPLFNHISHFGYLIIGNHLFILGGMNALTQQTRPSQMISINLDTGATKRYESKTSSSSTPGPRLKPHIVGLQKNILLVYGGQTWGLSNKRFLNDMYTFKIQTKTWTKVQDGNGSYSMRMPLLIRPTLVNIGQNSVIIFGGKRQIARNDGSCYIKIIKQETNQIVQPSTASPPQSHIQKSSYITSLSTYKIKILTKMINYRADCSIKGIHNANCMPSNHFFIKIMKYNEKGVIAITAQMQNYSKVYFWYYQFASATWIQIKVKNKKQDDLSEVNWRNSQNFAVSHDRIFVINTSVNIQQNGTKILVNQFKQLTFLFHELELVLKYNISHDLYAKNLCSICAQQGLQYYNYTSVQQPNLQQSSQPALSLQPSSMPAQSLYTGPNIDNRYTIPAYFLEKYIQELDFPFSAVGLLVDNCVLTKAKNCNIYLNVGSLSGEKDKDKQKDTSTSKSKYLIIQDNGFPCCVWSPQQKSIDFLQIITQFSTPTPPQQLMSLQDNRQMMQKHLKQLQQKQRTLIKQFTLFQKSAKNNQPTPPPAHSYPQPYPSLHHHLKNEKDFQKQQQEYMEKRHRLQHKEKMIEIQWKCKKYCNNLKIGGIALGEAISFACKQKKDQESSEYNPIDKEVRRYYFLRKQKIDRKQNKQIYVGYGFVLENGNAADPKMESTIRFCNKQFKKQMKILNDKLKSMNNVTIIADLKNTTLTEEQVNSMCCPQLRLKKKQNDVFFGPGPILSHLQTTSISHLSQLCDISLKGYLGLLYLGRDDREDPNIYLSVRDNPLQFVNNQPHLPIIDKLKNSKKLIEISEALDFGDECQVVQVYYNPQNNESQTSSNTTLPAQGQEELANLSQRINTQGFLMNGVLIYQHGRLITRYDLKLGKLLDNIETLCLPKTNRANRLMQLQSYGNIFGFIDVKDQYGVNIYSTELFYPRTFQKYYARLKLIGQIMEQKYKDGKDKPKQKCRQKRPRIKDNDKDDWVLEYQKISKKQKTL